MPLYPGQLRYTYEASDRSYAAETFPTFLAIGGTALPTAGRIEFAKVRLPVAASITNVVHTVATVGNTLTAGQCFVALYTEARVLIGQSADQAAAWVSTGVKTAALAGGPFSLAAGNYYVAFWFNGTTGPALTRATGAISTPGANAGTSGNLLLCGTADTGITTTGPAPMGAQTAASIYWWAALS